MENGPSGKKFKRAYIACLNCRVRKVKCDLGSPLNPKDRCARCERERRDCVFVDLKKRSVGNYHNEVLGELSLKAEPTEKSDTESPTPKHFSTMEGALVFLANAAGKIATADSRDNIDARAKYDQLERHSERPTPVNSTRQSASGESSPQIEETKLPLSMASLIPPYYNRPILRNKRLAVPPAENAYAVRPNGTNDLAHIEYIGDDGILTAAEAEYLIRMFFLTMHPFFPHIPKFLHLAKVLSGYPILLCAILTIASRYHSLGTHNAEGVAKNIEIHDRLWLYVQRLISQTVWAEASTRSIGTVFAFLLFTEWNPRAIHWRWSDYANKADDATDTRAPAFNNQTAGSVSLADEPAGLGAMRRSYRMAWMLIGSAVRLAQDTGFMELSSKTFLATHIAEINSVMNMSRRSMLGHSLAEVELDHEEITEDDMERREDNEYKVLNMSEEDQKRVPAEYALHFTHAQRAQIELLQIMSLGHESLYGYKAQLGLLTQRQNLAVLSIMSPMINNWGYKYKSLLVPTSPESMRKFTFEAMQDPESKQAIEVSQALQNESFIFEFNYTKLYIYSLALSPSSKTRESFRDGKLTLKLDEISKSAKYIEQAFNAANEILFVAHRVHKLKMLRFMPVRWVTRIVRAVAFIVKCYLTITAHKTSEHITKDSKSSSVDNFDSTILSLSLISVEEIVQSIQKAAITLRDCSPDELHLCTRYSNVLMYLYSEMKGKLKSTKSGESNDKHVPEEDAPKQTSNNNIPIDNDSNFTTTNAKAAVDSFEADSGLFGDNEVMDWFANNKNVGLDFVGPWTELIEQHLEDHHFSIDEQVFPEASLEWSQQ